MFRPNLRMLIPLLLLALLLAGCGTDSGFYTDPRINPDEALPLGVRDAVDSESYTAPRVNPDEALDYVPPAGIQWPAVTDSEFYTDPHINPDEAPGTFSP